MMTCAGPCARPMRPRRTRIDDYPGTVAYHSSGLCSFCYKHHPSRSRLTRTAPRTTKITPEPAFDILPVNPRDWQESAACAQVGPAPFYVTYGDRYVAARAICAGCPVLDLCRDWVLNLEGGQPVSYRAGFIAGMLPGERHQLGIAGMRVAS